jgi:hypothetical protein
VVVDWRMDTVIVGMGMDKTVVDWRMDTVIVGMGIVVKE